MKSGIIIFQRILPHYRAGVFKKICSQFNNIKIIYGQPLKNETLHNYDLRNNPCFEKTINIYFNEKGNLFISGIVFKIFKYKPSVIISVFNVGNLNIYILLLLKIFLKHKLILWSFGYEPSRAFDPDKYFSDKMRLYLSQRADAVIFYWDRGLNEIKKFSKKTEHYFTANNTLDTEALIELKKKFDRTGKENLKSELGINENFHFVYVGRLIADKEVNKLIKAFRLLEKEYKDCRMTIIGDGPEIKKLLKLSDDLEINNINFTGEITDDEISGKWIYVSDAFVMPGRLGLSVIHSFCFGTPVITQDKGKYFHGEGIGYIKDNINGMIVIDDDGKNISAAMNKIIHDRDFSNELRKNAFQTAVNEGSIQNMISGFSKAIDYVLKK